MPNPAAAYNAAVSFGGTYYVTARSGNRESERIYFASAEGLPGISDAPRVRLVQQQQLSTALPWAVRALELPPLKHQTNKL